MRQVRDRWAARQDPGRPGRTAATAAPANRVKPAQRLTRSWFSPKSRRSSFGNRSAFAKVGLEGDHLGARVAVPVGEQFVACRRRLLQACGNCELQLHRQEAIGSCNSDFHEFDKMHCIDFVARGSCHRIASSPGQAIGSGPQGGGMANGGEKGGGGGRPGAGPAAALPRARRAQDLRPPWAQRGGAGREHGRNAVSPSLASAGVTPRRTRDCAAAPRSAPTCIAPPACPEVGRTRRRQRATDLREVGMRRGSVT